MRRMFAVAATAAALAIPASIAAVGVVPATTAGASGSTVACSSVKLKGTLESGTLTFSKCLPSAGKEYKSASASSTTLQAGGNLVWKKSGATTTISVSASDEGASSLCPKADSLFDASGSVTAASTSGTGIPAAGDAISAQVCIDIAKNKLALVKHTDWNM